MKKFAFLSLSALMMLAASCSDKDEPVRPPVPTEPVITVPSVADQVTLDLPEQSYDYEIDGNNYRFNYSNGQYLTFTMEDDVELGRYAIICKMGGASDIVIPPTVKAIGAESGKEIVWEIRGLDLYDGGAEGVKKVTLSKSVIGGYNKGVLGALNADWLRTQIGLMPDLENFEIENGLPGFCSINGAVYTSDLKSLVAVPRMKSGVFTIAENTTTVQTHAFHYCNKLTGITFPAAIKEIADEAVIYNDMLVLLNMEPAEAPLTSATSFGRMAQTAELRIPAGSKPSYFPEKPELEIPVAPIEPPEDSSWEEYDEYLRQLAAYNDAMEEYNKVMSVYTRPIGFRNFKNVVETTFE
ncbi:MAG: leucine-rich repeat domain-containing protein [Muribaculaceae bacterium]|nr:leucine-rich repeat domain-containing protein [Muribaculaceae bacterium]